MMRVFINAGFGEEVGHDSLQWLKRLGVSGIRQDIPWGAPTEYIEKLLVELVEVGLDGVFIIGGNLSYSDGQVGELPKNWRPGTEELSRFAREFALRLSATDMHGCIEIGNEPELESQGGPLAKDPARWGQWLRVLSETIWTVNDSLPVISGGLSGLNKRTLRYLEKAIKPYELSRKLIFGIHPYRQNKPATKDLNDLKEQYHQFLRLIQHRKFAVTELGWHTAPQYSNGLIPCFRKPIRFTDQDVARFCKHELETWKGFGSMLFCWFQLNDGSNQFSAEDNFGIRDFEGRPKPVSETIGKWQKGARWVA